MKFFKRKKRVYDHVNSPYTSQLCKKCGSVNPKCPFCGKMFFYQGDPLYYCCDKCKIKVKPDLFRGWVLVPPDEKRLKYKFVSDEELLKMWEEKGYKKIERSR